MIRADTLAVIAAVLFIASMIFNAWATINTP